jgi:hypothetical protein
MLKNGEISLHHQHHRRQGRRIAGFATDPPQRTAQQGLLHHHPGGAEAVCQALKFKGELSVHALQDCTRRA